MTDLLSAESHFKFGENWKSFLSTVDEGSIASAEECLAKLVGPEDLAGKTFLDIGCGSGLSLLAASRLGASELVGVDIDASSVEATRNLMSRAAPDATWSARVQSVFDLTPEQDGLFDIVHSWGVLHHTGDMWTAVRRAAALVKPGGLFVIALYRKTPFCGAWRIEKRFYTRASRPVQRGIEKAYKAVWFAQSLARGRDPNAYIRQYKGRRGMDWSHDVHDWLGGYPYESASAQEIRRFLKDQGFTVEREVLRGRSIGLLGSGCDEFRARRG
jgi:SAM-dependent methyltransferase